MNLSGRQQREIAFFRQAAAEAAAIADRPVNLEPARSPLSWRTRLHPYVNAYWVILRKARALPLPGKRVLVPGCGYGEDALQLAYLGGRVSAADLSAETVAIARRRAQAPAQAPFFTLLGGPRIGLHRLPGRASALCRRQF
jgi:SAM-dependent methyltransferase